MNDRALATVSDYDGMVAAVSARIVELGVTYQTLEALAVLPDGYIAKVLGPNHSKNFGPLAWNLVPTLGCKFVMVEDAEKTATMRPKWDHRKKALPTPRTMVRTPRATWLFTARSGRRVRKAHLKKLSKAEKSEIGRSLVNARWQREREKESRRRAAARVPG